MTTGKLPATLKLLAVLCCFTFVVYGICFNMIGASASVMMEYFHVNEAQIGLITTLQAVGMLVVTLFAVLWGENFNKIYLTTLGLVLMGAGAVMVGLVPTIGGGSLGYMFVLAMVFIAGLGFTFIDIMVNSAIADIYPERKNTILPIAHTSYGVGAMVAPLLVTAVVTPVIPASYANSYLLVGIATVAVFLAFVIAGGRITKDTPYVRKKKKKTITAEIFLQKESWIMLAAGVACLAFQIGTSTWLPSYCQREMGMPFDWAGRMVTMFFAGALAMRLVTPLLLKKLKASVCYVLFGLLAAACMLAAMFVANIAVFTVLVTASGFFQGAQAILIVLICCGMFPNRTASASAILTMSIGIAMLVFPYVMGLIGEAVNFRASMLLITGASAVSALIVLLLGRRRELC